MKNIPSLSEQDYREMFIGCQVCSFENINDISPEFPDNSGFDGFDWEEDFENAYKNKQF